ncbi:MAG: T9SS type A sorting domain-containing protein, partial [Leadbetterella sp.]|nr:T9SS type A sorting domain-containing protein [Leadbetterella sp.]
SPGQIPWYGALEQYIIRGDTLLGSVFYHKIYSTINSSNHVPGSTIFQSRSGPTFIRFDSFENKVYYRPNVDSTDRLLYDFNLQVGDTLPIQPIIYQPGLVDSIENVSLFGISVKKFYTSEFLDHYEKNYILAGMGGSNGLTYNQPVLSVVSGGILMTRLVCFQSGDSIYSPTNSDCPFLETISTKNVVREEISAMVSPNPTQGVFTLFVSEKLRNANFTVTDCLGRKVQSGVLTGQTTIGQLPASGVYFWCVEKNGRLIKAGKLICE